MAKREYSGKFVIRIDPETHRFLASRAYEAGGSLNDQVKFFLDEAKRKYSKNIKKSLAV